MFMRIARPSALMMAAAAYSDFWQILGKMVFW